MSQTRTIKIDVDAKDGISQVDDLKQGVKDTSKAASDSKGSFSKMTGGVKGLSVAFKALGIGLIVTAFTKLKNIFSGNIETARKFERINAQLGAAFDVVRDAVEPLFMSLSKLFTDPLGSLQKFAEAIQQNLINRVKGLVDTFGALGKVIKGVFTKDLDLLKEGVNDAKDGFIQLNTGLDKAQRSKLADTFKGITKEIKEETQAMGRLTEVLQNVRDRERDMLTVRAKANKIIAESRLLAEDEALSMEERLVALKAAVAEEQRVANIELKIQEDKVNALQEIIDLGKSSEEDMQNLASERARLTELETASILKQKRVVTEIVTFEKQIETERKKIASDKQKRAEAEALAKQLGLEFDNQLTTAEINNLIKVEQKRQELAAKKEETDTAMFEKELEDFAAKSLTKEELEIQTATDKYNKLLAIADQYGLDSVTLTNNYEEQIKGIRKKFSDNELAITKAKVDADKALRVTAAKDILNSVAQLAGEGTATAKAAALAGILIDTAKGVSGAISAGAALPFPLNLGAIATGVASVMAGIVNAKAVLKKVPGGGGGGGDTSISVPTNTGGGGASGGSTTPASGFGPQVPNMQAIGSNVAGEEFGGATQAYVVESDISNAQALQQELDLKSTL